MAQARREADAGLADAIFAAARLEQLSTPIQLYWLSLTLSNLGRLDEALHLAAKVEDEEKRVSAHCAGAIAQGEAGLDPSPTLVDAVHYAQSVEQWAYGTSVERLLVKIVACQARCGLLSEARALAARIVEPKFRSDAWRTIAVAQAKAGLDPAQAFERAIRAAGSTPQENWREGAFASTATAQAQAGDFEGALETEELIGQDLWMESWRTTARRGIALAQVGAKRIEDAIRTAHRIERTTGGTKARCAIAIAMVEVGADPEPILDEALTIANEVGEPEALNDVAVALARAGADPNSAFLDAEEMCMRSNSLRHDRDKSVRQIVITRVQGHHFSEAVRAASRVPDENGRVMALTEILQGQEEAQLDFDQTLGAALSSAEEGVRHWWRDDVLSRVGTVQVSVGQFIEAESTAASIDNTNVRARLLRSIAVAQTEVGNTDDALGIANKLEDDYWSVSTLCRIADRQRRPDEARAIIAVAANRASRLKTVSTRFECVLEIAAVEARAGLDACGRLTDAVSLAMRMDDASSRAVGLGKVSSAQARAGVEADPGFDEAVRTARELATDEEEYALGEIAGAMADSGLVEEATHVISMIEDAWRRVTALCIAATRSASSSHAESFLIEALAIAEEQEDSPFESTRSSCLDQIARTQAHSGDVAGALDTIARVDGSYSQCILLYDLGEAEARKGRIVGRPLTEALTAIASDIRGTEHRAYSLGAIATARMWAGDVDAAFASYDLVQTDRERALERIGAAITSLDSCEGEAALAGYLPRAARFVRTAWYGCGVIAHLFPDKATELARFLRGAIGTLSVGEPGSR